ncbi:MAG: alanine--tRNA ligase [Phycisphaerales bacterium JB058]
MSTQPTTVPTTASQIRQAFIDYFVNLPGHEHTFVPSSPAAPVDDPTLLFTNAGMNQFKPCFLGTVEKGSPLAGVKRAVNSQKCIRAGGTHNDLDDVGLDTYHHTFFEMLGNWSFGDFFKAEIIEWSFKFLTEVCQLPADRLYATYFEGDPAQDLAPDNEARDLWLKYLPADHVLPGNYKDNFWEMGDTGPCGPCSEIHYDRIGGRNAASLVNQDDPNVLEVWNLVFIQFNREKDGEGTVLRPLPAKHVDTGMGLERLVSVIQNKTSNYDTDVFTPIFEAIQKVTGFERPYQGKLGDEDPDRVDMAYRVIADHIRTLVVAIADGASPSNEGRGYVLRRVLRRAVRFGRQKLGAQTGFLTDLVPTVAKSLEAGFPEIAKNTARIAEIIADEEQSFGKTLDKGISQVDFARIRAEQTKNRIIDDIRTEYGLNRVTTGTMTLSHEDSQRYRKGEELVAKELAKPAVISGEDAFTLYDTYGFPLDLTEIMASERGLTVDVAGFERAMEEQRERSRAGSKFGTGGEEMKLEPDALARLAHMNVPATDTESVYADKTIRSRIRAIFDGKTFEETVTAADTGLRKIGVILDATNFYAEAGGQIADVGRLHVVNEHHRANDPHTQSEFKVEDVKRFGDYVMHIGHIVRGSLHVQEEVECHVDRNRRRATQGNHTATHLLNLGLRRTLGEGVDQKGSLVEPERLRFDFSHSGPMTDEETRKVETIVREEIGKNHPVGAGTGPLYLAKGISGLRAVFGEKYPDPVRVVAVGASVQDVLDNPGDEKWADLSIEFCGGTHVANTSEIGAFALVGETGIAKGVRRVEALTGVPAKAALDTAQSLREQIESMKSLSDADLAPAIAEVSVQLDSMTLSLTDKAALREQLGELQERAKAAAKQAAAAARETAVKEARVIADSALADLRPYIVGTVSAGEDRGALQAALKVLQDKCPKAGALLLSAGAERVALIAWVPDAQIKQGLKAGDWIRAAAEACGGKGGGKPNQAQGGGTDPSKLGDAAKAASEFAARAIN